MTSGECAIKGRTRRAKEQGGTAHTRAHAHMCTYGVHACTVHTHTYVCTQTGAHMHKRKYTHVQAHTYRHAHTPRQVLTEKLLWGASWAPRTWRREPRR